MTVHLRRRHGDSRRTLTVLMALVAAAVVTTVAAPAPASAPASARCSRRAPAWVPSRASPSGRVQRVLHSRGYSLGRPGVDGRFGPLTDAAVRHFQADRGSASRRHRRPEDEQGRQPHRAPPAAVLVGAPTGSRTKTVDAAEARDHEPSGGEDRARRDQ
jgi:peptidoglycan hydrolase-like protein with peptidoglycan-binding domain